MNKSIRKKRLIAVLAGVLAFLGMLALTLGVVGATGLPANLAYAEALTPVQSRGLTPVLEDGVWHFDMEEDFKILQLSDLHLVNSALGVKNDRKALEALNQLVHRARPDLVILTGDLSYPFALLSGSRDNLAQAELLCTAMESLGLPYAVVLGNHDSEPGSKVSREELGSFYQSRPNCLFLNEGEALSGVGNYAIHLDGPDGAVMALMLLDSNDYLGSIFTYDTIHADQVAWYREHLLALAEAEGRTVPSLAFFHIPLPQVGEAWEALQGGDPETVRHFGTAVEKISSADQDSGLFETFLEVGTLGAFFGHDHKNDLSVTYRGVRLTYGMSVDYFAYFNAYLTRGYRGGTLITVRADGTFDCEQLELIE